MNAFEQRRQSRTVPPSAHGSFAFVTPRATTVTPDVLDDLSPSERAEVLDPASYVRPTTPAYLPRPVRRA